MAFPIIDQIERLITEHGSAAILRDHLALLREQLASSDTAKKEAQAENEQLKIRLADANAVIDRYKQADENRKKNRPRFAETDENPLG